MVLKSHSAASWTIYLACLPFAEGGKRVHDHASCMIDTSLTLMRNLEPVSPNINPGFTVGLGSTKHVLSRSMPTLLPVSATKRTSARAGTGTDTTLTSDSFKNKTKTARRALRVLPNPKIETQSLGEICSVTYITPLRVFRRSVDRFGGGHTNSLVSKSSANIGE